jgi:hypothetical protein
MDAGLVSLHMREGSADFIDLPWHLPLAQWAGACARLVEMERGISRHDVVFVQSGRAVYALKELPPKLAEREYDMLRGMEERRLPSVVAAGYARARAWQEGSIAENGVLITHFLDGSLPYRTLFMNRGLERYRERLLDAMAGLLVRLHVGGFYWGDCSLSNTLFRRDAGELAAYAVDAETSEQHERLSDGQRALDLMILEENVAGELADLAIVVDRDYHRRLLHGLTGLEAGDRQAALLLNELKELKATLSAAENRSVSLSATAFRWQEQCFRPAVSRLEAALDEGDPVERYCEVLEHKWYLSERAQRDVGLDAALEDYVRLRTT